MLWYNLFSSQKLCHVKRIKKSISGRIRSFYTTSIQYKKHQAKVCVTLFLDLSIFRWREKGSLILDDIYLFPNFLSPIHKFSTEKKWKEKMTFDGSTQQYIVPSQKHLWAKNAPPSLHTLLVSPKKLCSTKKRSSHNESWYLKNKSKT